MLESKHQIAFVKWFRYNHTKLTIFHIPNGGLRSSQEAAKFKRMGVMAGVFDLFVLDFKLFIEMKNKKGKLTERQKDFKKICNKNGYSTIVAYGFDDAIDKFTIFYNDYGIIPTSNIY